MTAIQSEPEYWWVREKETGRVIPVELWKTTNPEFNDTIIMIGDSGGYDVKFYELLERVQMPQGHGA